MNGIIVYWSKYGSAKQYAQWLHEDTGFTVRPSSRPFARSLKRAEVVIAGGAIRMGRLKIAPWIKKHWQKIKAKRIIVFSTSGLPPDDTSMNHIWNRSLPEYIRNACEFHPLPGRLVFRKLGLIDKIMMHVGAFMANDKDVRENMLKGFDSVERSALKPVLESVKVKMN